MSNETIIYVVAAGCAALALIAWLGLFVIPAWKSYSHWWERIAATFLTLYVLAGSAHCHNMAGTRQRLWDRLLGWCGSAIAV